MYVHFPWCLSKCPYCDFVVHVAARDAIDHRGYAAALDAELGRRLDAAGSDGQLGSVFFGGGTPSLFDPTALGEVLSSVMRRFGASVTDLEVSVECDPSSLDYDVARRLIDAGANRLSIGVQSFDDGRLRYLGRIHDGTQAEAAMRAAVRAGAPRLSADLIYALPGENPELAAGEARRLVELGATHVSAYSLTIEPNTPFGRLKRLGRLPLCDDGIMAASFFSIDDALTSVGLEHYEVSNYAAPGQRSVHNAGYWLGRDYVGIGCGAYGTLSSGAVARRYQNPKRPADYLRAVQEGTLPDCDEVLDPPTRMRERIMLGLRTKEGIDLEATALELGVDPYEGGRASALSKLESRGRIVRQGSRISVPRDAWIFVDDTAAALF